MERKVSSRESVGKVRLASAVGAGMVAAHALAAVALRGRPEALSLATNSITVVSSLAACAALFLAARRSSYEQAQTRRSWWLFFAAIVMMMLGNLLWAALDLIAHVPPTPSPADILYLAIYAPVLVGILSLPTDHPSRAEQFRLAADLTLVMLVAGLAWWQVSASPYVGAGSAAPASIALAVAYPLADLGLAWALLFVLVRRHHRRERQAVLLLVAALAVQILTDIVFALDLAGNSYASGQLSDAGYTATAVLLGLAGLVRAQPDRRPPASDEGPERLIHSPAWTPLLPYLAAIAAFAILVRDLLGKRMFGAYGIAWGIGLATGLVLLRQALTLAENRRLYQQVTVNRDMTRAAHGQLLQLTLTLEKRVQERTAELVQSNRRLAMLHELDHTMRESQSLADSAEHVLADLMAHVGCDVGSVLVFETSGKPGFLVGRNAAGMAPDSGRGGLPPPPDLTDVDIAVERVEDTETVAQPSEQVRILRAIGIRSFVNLPLVCQGQMLGLLNLGFCRPGPFMPEAEGLALEVADLLAVAVYQGQLRELQARHAIELEERVESRTAELKAANESLRQAAERLRELDRLKSQFVSNVSHELRTPLSNMMLYIELLEVGRHEKRDLYLATLRRETSLLQGLIEDLLDLSRLDAGQVNIEPAEVALLPLVEHVVADRALLAADRGLELKMVAPPVLPVVQGDARRLVQVLTNLIANATNYTPPGGRIAVSLGTRRHLDREWVTLGVADTGPGIPPEEQKRLFDRFYRGAAARSSRTPGTGLGLAICDEIVMRHGGRITVDSTPGQGSTFTVWLPVVDGDGKN